MTLQAGYDPLLRSISEGDLLTLKRLFTTGQYSVNEEVCYFSEDEKNYVITPLYWAVKLNQREICRFLLKNGADPFKHMVYEYYPLHEACNNGSHGIVQEFIDADCNLNKRNCDGDTPLHIACLRGHIECICLLLAAGASRNEKNKKGHTPIQVAQFDQQTELYRLFEIDHSTAKSQFRLSPKREISYTERQTPFSSLVRHYKQPRPQSYHSSSQDDTSINRIKSLRSDITRTFSFSGSNHHSYHNDAPRSRNDFVRVRKPELSMKTVSQRPSLSYKSHDSQLVLPTQKLVPDPRRTQTCYEFPSLPPKGENRLKTPSPEPPLTPDDIEVDAVRPRLSSNREGRIRVGHMVQCIHPILKSRDASETVDIHSDCLSNVLFSIHREIGFSDDDFSAINQLMSKREDLCSNRPTPTDKDLEYVWGCDYSLINRHPIRVTRDTPAVDYAELTFHVKLENAVCSQNDKHSLLKVLVCLSTLEEDSPLDLCREGQIISSLPSHPNIAKCIHHCLANSRPFDRFTPFIHPATDDGHLKTKMSPQCSLLFIDYFSSSLQDFINMNHHPHSYVNMKKSHSYVNPSFPVSEYTLLSLIAQLLLAMTHLDYHEVILGNISASRIFIENNNLYFADFAFAYNLSECSDKTDLKSWIQTVPEEVFLTFPPELCEINDLPISSFDSCKPLNHTLNKCNVFCIGKLFQVLLATNSRQFEEFSKTFRYLLKNFLSDTDERLSAKEAVIYCFALLYGPSYDKCITLHDCQEWLMTETFHLFLSPSLKGHPLNYKTDTHTKLLFTYLCLATPEKLLTVIKKIGQITRD